MSRSPFGHVDRSLGKNTAAGTTGFITPFSIISKPIEQITDGIEMELQNTPGTKVPAEINTWFPQFETFCAAENITGTTHNVHTTRGALIRNPLEWNNKSYEAPFRYSSKADVMFVSHSWPR